MLEIHTESNDAVPDGHQAAEDVSSRWHYTGEALEDLLAPLEQAVDEIDFLTEATYLERLTGSVPLPEHVIVRLEDIAAAFKLSSEDLSLPDSQRSDFRKLSQSAAALASRLRARSIID